MRKLLLLLLVVISQLTYSQQKEIKPYDDATKYNLKIAVSKESLKEMPIADLNGNIIILQWFNIYCQGSKEILKTFNDYYDKYKNDVSFFAVSPNQLSTIIKFKETNQYDFMFCHDAAKLNNKYFPYSAEAHTVIINRKGICLHHGSFNLSDTLLDTLIKNDCLPLLSQKESIESYKLKQFRDEFEEYRKSMDRYSQTGFKIEPYNSSLTTDSWYRSNGKDYYGYNQPIYNIYRDGLLLKDDRIIISDSSKQKLSSMDTTNLYLVGFNIRKDNRHSNYHYQKVFKNYLDSAFGISSVLLKKRMDLKEQGIEPNKKIQYLEFLPIKERHTVYFATKQKRNVFKTGLKAGIGRSYYTFNDDQFYGEKFFAFKTGLFTQIKLNNFISVQPELIYQTNGSKGNYAKFRIHSLNTPINLMLTTSQQKPLGLFVKGGGYYSYNFTGNVEGQNLSFDNDIEKNIFGWTYSFGFWLGNRGALELTFYRGLSDLIKNSAIGDVKEKIWTLTKVHYF